MRLYSWGLAAVSLLFFGGSDNPDHTGSRLLHVEVLEVMAPGGCAMTAELAEAYLLPEIAGAERLAYICHSALREDDLAGLQAEAAARNAKLAAAATATIR